MTLACLAGLSAAGCGADDASDVRALFEDIRLAHATGDYATVCARMSPTARRQLAEMGHGPAVGTCVRNLSEHLATVVPSRRDRLPARILDVSVDGGEATLTARLAGGRPTDVRFVDDGGGWRLDHVFGISGRPAPDMR